MEDKRYVEEGLNSTVGEPGDPHDANDAVGARLIYSDSKWLAQKPLPWIVIWKR